MRKTVRKTINALLLATTLLSLVACSSSAGQSSVQESEGDMTEATSTTEETSQEQDEGAQETTGSALSDASDVHTADVQTASETQAPEDEDSAASSGSGSNMLVAVFSLAGEQYSVGVIEEGNTAIIADMITEQTGADLFRIENVTPYPDTYNELLEVSREEEAAEGRPEIADTVENMDDYDVIFLGYPIWWGDMPQIIYGFLESYDFSGKTIVPFCTHGGSGLSGTPQSIADTCPGATVAEGLAISGATAQNERDQAREAVIEWLTEGGFI